MDKEKGKMVQEGTTYARYLNKKGSKGIPKFVFLMESILLPSIFDHNQITLSISVRGQEVMIRRIPIFNGHLSKSADPYKI